ncbi:MAG: hypothetical protein RLZZ458_2217, partial [Planctomycetota bacterium]
MSVFQCLTGLNNPRVQTKKTLGVMTS